MMINTDNQDQTAIFLNLSDYSSSKWSHEQIAAALELGFAIINVPFPQIDSKATRRDIHCAAYELFKEILEKYEGYNLHILVQGEMTFVYAFVWQCDEEWTKGSRWIRCYNVINEVKRVEEPSTENFEISTRFQQFRSYF